MKKKISSSPVDKSIKSCFRHLSNIFLIFQFNKITYAIGHPSPYLVNNRNYFHPREDVFQIKEQ